MMRSDLLQTSTQYILDRTVHTASAQLATLKRHYFTLTVVLLSQNSKTYRP